MVEISEISKLRVVDLKAELKKRDLPGTGLKAELAARLIKALEAEQNQREGKEDPPADGEKDGATAAAAATDQPADGQPANETEAAQPAAVKDDASEAAAPSTDAKAAAAESKPQAEQPPATDPDAAAGDAPAAVDPPAKPEKPSPAGETKEAAPVSEAELQAAAKASATVVAAAAADAAAEAASPAQEPATAADADAALQSAAGGADADTAKADASQPAAEPAAAAAPMAVDAPADTADAAPAAEPAAAAEHATPPEAASAPAAEAPDGLIDEAPEMDFGVEEEEPAEAAKPKDRKSEVKPEKRSAAKSAPGKRGRSPVPGVKAPARVDVGRRDSADAQPSKQQRTDAGGSQSQRTPTQSGGLARTPTARQVPPPNMKPTAALRIEGFMRPFTLPQAKQLLSQQDCVIKHFWMPSIKNLAYIIYETAEQAETIRQATYNLQWPKDGKRLQPRFVPVEEAESAGTAATPTTPHTPAAASTPAAAAAPAENRVAESPRTVDARQAILEKRQQRAAASGGRGSERKQPEPQELSLDELFRRTTSLPVLYWLPADAAQIAKNKAADAAPNGVA